MALLKGQMRALCWEGEFMRYSAEGKKKGLGVFQDIVNLITDINPQSIILNYNCDQIKIENKYVLIILSRVGWYA
jgi:hypothetical protein